MKKGMKFWQDKKFHKLLYGWAIIIAIIIIGFMIWKSKNPDGSFF